MDTLVPHVCASSPMDILKKVAINNDGVYMVPSPALEYTANVNLRSDWLENLGLEEPVDLESYRNVLHAFTYDDPEFPKEGK